MKLTNTQKKLLAVFAVFTLLGTVLTLILILKRSSAFPDNVYIFTQADAKNPDNIKNKIGSAFGTQGGKVPVNNGQDSVYNFAFLFMPGTYTVDIPIGYYTHVAGLGKSSDDVIINGGPMVSNGSEVYSNGALNNFWRSCENMTVNPLSSSVFLEGSTMTYAVSQASSLRSVNINGNLALSEMTGNDMGYSSGGFISNCKISGILAMGSQQQFICRNTEYGTFPNISWNHVNVGCTSTKGIRTGCCIPTDNETVARSSNLTVVEETPSVYEKPYLASVNPTNPNNRESIINSIVVICPGLSNSSGTSNNINTIIPISKYRIVKKDITSKLLNQILSDSNIQCIIFSPGRYNIDSPINLSGQLLFGLGVPILRSTKDNCIVSGYGKICGIVFDADSTGNGTNVLVDLNDKTHPSYLWDTYFRVGGGTNNNDKYFIDTMLHIGGDNSILDNVWCWVADHYADDNTSVGFDKAKCKIGLHVSGDNVIAYGVFAEHTFNRNVLWTGDKGQVYMFQSEFNYYIPSDQSKFDTSNFVSYEITGSNVEKHTLYGAGAYSYFALKPDDPNNGPMAKAGFMWDDTHIKVDYKNLVTVFLNGYGGITNIFNNQGSSVKYSQPLDPTKRSPTQIAIACKGEDNCGCYPLCDNTKSTCDKDLRRCKPNGDHVCSSDISNSVKCGSDKWTVGPDYKGCFPEDGAKRAASQRNTNYCLTW